MRGRKTQGSFEEEEEEEEKTEKNAQFNVHIKDFKYIIHEVAHKFNLNK